jgi:hypothetical protein
MVAFDKTALRIKDGVAVGGREAAFFERYQAAFSAGAGGLDDCAAFIAGLDALPGDVRRLLTTEFMSGELFLGRASDRAARTFLRSRAIRRHERSVLMPVVELINHDAGGEDYDLADGVSINGTFADEVLARYRSTDPFQMFKSWGFASAEPAAFSLPVFVPWGARILVVRRLLSKPKMRATVPKIAMRGKFIELSHLLIGDAENPDWPRQMLARAVRKIEGGDIDGVLDEIRAINRARFAKLADAVSGQASPLTVCLCKTCDYQLAAMSS